MYSCKNGQTKVWPPCWYTLEYTGLFALFQTSKMNKRLLLSVRAVEPPTTYVYI